MKIYNVDKSMPEWIVEHKDELYREILLQCEDKLFDDEIEFSVDIALLRTDEGLTKFVIKDFPGIIESLEKAMKYFVEKEVYELAARTRDCIKSWKEMNK